VLTTWSSHNSTSQALTKFQDFKERVTTSVYLMRIYVPRVPNMINNIISTARAALQWKAPEPVQQETRPYVNGLPLDALITVTHSD
jgi:hypothetical protein